MMILSQESARLGETERPNLKQIFGPISAGLEAVEACLAETLGEAKDAAIREVINFLLGSPGKRIRPALVLLSTGAAADGIARRSGLGGAATAVAAAVELIHMASVRIKQLVGSHIDQARSQLEAAYDSDFKESLHRLTAHIAVSLSDILTR